MSKFTIPSLSDKKYTELDKKSSAVFGTAINAGTKVRLDFIDDNDLEDAEKGRTIGTDPTPRFFVYVSGKERKTDPRISLAGLAKPTFRDPVCESIVKTLWTDDCVDIRANSYTGVVEHAKEYNKQVAAHTDDEGICEIECVYAGTIPVLKTRKGEIKDVTYRIWKWVTAAHSIEEAPKGKKG